MLDAFIDVLIILLNVLWWIIIIQAVLSWLIVLRVLNTHNDFILRFLRALDRMTEPMYRPIRRILPDFGGLDFSPLVILILIAVLQRLLIGLKVELVTSSL